MDKHKPIDLSKVRMYSIKERKSKVNVKDFAKVSNPDDSFKEFIQSLPHILTGNTFRNVLKSIVNAKNKHKPIIWGLGAYVIKTGLNPIIINLMKNGFVTTVALTGSGVIHDVEIAIHGETSEDVTLGLADGKFGMVKETGELINGAIKEGVKKQRGIGESVGKKLLEINAPYKQYSILANAKRLNIPVTVHVAIGTDIIHMHPSMNGSATGEATFIDFRILCSLIKKLGNGGVYINAGSAVILPEVFLKALTIANNLGYSIKNFTTVNLDLVHHYRPVTNVVKRPTEIGGRGYTIIGCHELIIPLLSRSILEWEKGELT